MPRSLLLVPALLLTACASNRMEIVGGSNGPRCPITYRGTVLPGEHVAVCAEEETADFVVCLRAAALLGPGPAAKTVLPVATPPAKAVVGPVQPADPTPAPVATASDVGDPTGRHAVIKACLDRFNHEAELWEAVRAEHRKAAATPLAPTPPPPAKEAGEETASAE